MPNKVSQQEFIRRLLPKKGKIAWLLGAGASISANMPTAQEIIWDLKKRFYCSEENQTFQGNDVQTAPVREKIQTYLDSKGHLQRWANEEYSYYFQLLFGDDYSQQRDYLLDALSSEKISISAGQRALAGLLSLGYIPCVFSTNFDEVVEAGYSKVTGKTLAPFHIEGSYAALDSLNDDRFPMYVKLHGDFRYKSLKNLENDLQEANEELGKCVIQVGSRFGLFVAGYSGRDKSVMSLLGKVLENNNPFPHGLYWAVLKGSNLSPDVALMIEKAQKVGVDAYIVEIDDYVAMMSAIWKQIPDKTAELEAAVNANSFTMVDIPLPAQGSREPLIRFNALPIQTLPHMVYSVKPKKPLDWEAYGEIKFKFRGKIITFKGKGIFAWGSLHHINEAFGADAEVKEIDITSDLENLEENKALKGALEEALCRAIVDATGLNFKQKKHFKYLTLPIPSSTAEVIDADKFPLLKNCFGKFSGSVPGLEATVKDYDTGEEKSVPVSWSEAVQVGIAEMNGGYVATFRPEIWISPKSERRHAKDFIYKRVSGNWETTRKNDVLDGIVTAWLNTITNSSQNISVTLTAYPEAKQAGKAVFQLLTGTSYSKRG